MNEKKEAVAKAITSKLPATVVLELLVIEKTTIANKNGKEVVLVDCINKDNEPIRIACSVMGSQNIKENKAYNFSCDDNIEGVTHYLNEDEEAVVHTSTGKFVRKSSPLFTSLFMRSLDREFNRASKEENIDLVLGIEDTEQRKAVAILLNSNLL